MRFARNPAVVFSNVDDRLMMMNPEQAEFVTLSPTGGAVWDALAEPGSCDVVVARLRADYPEADPEQMRGDVEKFLAQLADAGIVQTQD
jgi:hypothetical protein